MTRRIRIIVVAVLIALAGAWVGAFAGSRLALEFTPDLPSGAAAEELRFTAFPGLRVYGGGNAPIIEPFGDGEGVKYGSVGYWVKHTEATRNVAAYSAGVRDRLAAAGWDIHDYRVVEPEPLVDAGAEYDARFWATRPGLVLSFSDHYWSGRQSYDSNGAAGFELWRQPPAGVTAATWGGAAAGALLVLILAVWVHRSAHPPARGLLKVGAVTCFVLLLPSTLRPGEETPMDSPWWGGFYDLGRGPAVLAAIVAGVMILYAVARRPAVHTLARGIVQHRRIAGATVLVALLAAVLPWALSGTAATAQPCHPTGPPPESPEARDGTHVKIFVSNTSTPQERALVDAAIFRSNAGSLGELIWQPDSEGFRQTYCGGGKVPAAAVATLPYYFDMDLANAATYPALTDELQGLAGVVAVRRSPN
ncbi:hypothetical protein [Actinoplanes sp. NPDC049265]|uniref:hypothetical protein n=1 Tax=Actinoplanes sp. NPDC049265 TaxID=3363902 RepID=UPI00371BBD90